MKKTTHGYFFLTFSQTHFYYNPTMATKFYGFFYKPLFFFIKPSLPHSEYWYVFRDMNKTNQIQYLEELWERKEESSKVA